jgi:hypothetical protein
MPSTDRKLELKAKTSVAQTGLQPCVYAKGLNETGSERQTAAHVEFSPEGCFRASKSVRR